MKSSKTIVESYLKNEDWRVKENSNASFSFGSLNKYITAEVSKDYWLHEVYPEHIARAYIDGYIHIHDLGGLSLYCCGYSLKDILLKGVRGVPNIPVSAPAKHFDSVLNQCANLVTVFQNEIMGAVAFNGFDTLLAPFIKQDKLSYEQVKQQIQNFVFSVNSNSRAGAEPAFFNLTFDLTPPADMLNEYAIIGGELVSFTYGSCQQEMDMLNRVFYEVMLQGDANGKLFAYPIPTYNIHSRFDWDNPNNKLLWEMAGKYGTPYFANFINSDLDISDVRSMCPLHGDEKVLVRNGYHNEFQISTIKNLYKGGSKEKVYDILFNGEIKKATLHRFDGLTFYKVRTVNGFETVFSSEHQHLVKGNQIKKTCELTTADYIPFNITPVEGRGLNYDDGLMVGAYMGDGSLKDEYAVVYSLNDTTKQELMNEIVDIARDKFGAKIHISQTTSGIGSGCINVTVTSKMLRGLIEDYVSGKALEKELNVKCIDRSMDFRRGIMDGYSRTDGGTQNRIYSASKKAMDSLAAMLMSMGIPSKVTVDHRDKTTTLSDNPIYALRPYNMKNGQLTYTNTYVKEDGYMWFRIDSIEKLDSDAGIGYCFEVDEDGSEPYFTLPSGWITHNCRLKLDLRELRHRNGGLFGAGDSTGSIGVVTLNLPRIAYETKGDKDAFFHKLAHYLDIAKESLEIKRKWLQENVIDTHLLPAYMEYVGTIDNHFSTIGVLGMNEMCENFMGKNILDPEAHAFCYNVGEFIRNQLLKYQDETGHLYNYEATPAESTCYRFALIDKKTYPDIITQGEGKDCYYTNSCHIPVSLVKDINSTFAHQDDLQTQFTGGTVIHVWLEGGISGDHAKQIVKAMFENYRVPYMSLSPISRYCDEHGYVKEIVDKCPICKRKLKLYQRITGYLRCVDNFNRGKAAEFKDRVQISVQ